MKSTKQKCSHEAGKSKTPEEERPQDISIKQIDAPKGSQVVYLAQIDLPEEFLSAVAAEDVDIPNRKSFAIRLNETKIGQAKSIEKFLNKMARLQSVIPFATIRYIAIPVGRKRINSKARRARYAFSKHGRPRYGRMV